MNVTNTTLSILAAAGIATCCAGAERSAACSVSALELHPNTYWVQSLRSSKTVVARAPQGKFILVRTGRGELVALRFTAATNAPAEGPAYGCARYEVFDLAKAGRPLICAGDASDFAARGFHPVAWNPGNNGIPCVPGSAKYAFPSQLWLRSNNEVAVTKWSALEQVNAANPTLRWFRFASGDEDEAAVDIPVSALP